MKFSLALACVLAVAVAEPPVPQDGQVSPQYGPPSAAGYTPGGGRGRAQPAPQYGVPSSGYSDEEPANYEFKYDVEDQESGVKFGHEEARQGDVAQGRYYVLLPDGRTQLVEYVADQDGYRPKISYEGGEGGYSRGPSGGYPRGGPRSPGYTQ